jgi:anti-sigma regulatory factor (Ser/Thr protein kinase)
MRGVGVPESRLTATAFELALTADADSVARAGTWLAAVASELGLADELRQRIDLAVAEALANIVEHGQAGAGGRGIAVRLSTRGDVVELEIEDGGGPFDPLAHEPPPLASRLEDAAVGGYGLRLIRAAMDECRYRRAEGRNRLTLVARPRRTLRAPAP